MIVAKHLKRLAGAATLSMVVASSVPAQQNGGVAYTSGGVGAEGRDALLAQQSGYSLKLVFAYTSGAFLAEVPVTITDAAGSQVLSAVSRGPWFLARLPAGAYRVTAEVGGSAQTADLQVPETGLVEHVMRWQPPAGPAEEPAAEWAIEPVTEPAPRTDAIQDPIPTEPPIPDAELEPAPEPAPAAPSPSGERLAPVEDRSPPPGENLAPVEER